MKICAYLTVCLCLPFVLLAEDEGAVKEKPSPDENAEAAEAVVDSGFERFKTVLDRMPFGRPPPGFNPDAPGGSGDGRQDPAAAAEAAGLAGRVSLEVGDACALACADASADVAICAFGFRNFPDRVRTLREVVRVLAAGGHLLVLELFRPRCRPLAALTATWMACVARLFAGGAREDYAYLRASIGETCTEAEFGQQASAAGLEAVWRKFFFPACSCLLFRKNMVK